MALNPPLPAWSDCRIWVIGASSGIGAATAKALLEAGARVALSARNARELTEVVGSNPRALIEPLDFTDRDALRAAWQRIRAAWGDVDLVLIVAGTHVEMRAWDLDADAADALLRTNLHGPIGTCAVVLPALLAQGHGAIGIVSSVAGYRGLPKALLYGASKAALINFAEALYLDVHPRGLGVYLIDPGFVKTPLTDRNEFEMPALIRAEDAAGAILDGLRAGRFEIHFPRRFTLVMKLMRVLPYRWYFALVHGATGQ
ncbi:MAG TPA: SDR family NAD(P)-dependent oxidoreductase [Casimicrobiaceae bacterium]|nr:SDR family NAD(P)-dependent oxidoreductase [Casimicrobiaceae bacterium]